MDNAYKANVELQAKAGMLNQEAEFMRTLFDVVRRLFLGRFLLPTLPTKGKSFPFGGKLA